jgi:two-component system, chemotaxis family, chemotaxis protein CheY
LRCWALNSMKSVRALIVDDSSVMRKIVERALRQAGVELTELREAGNGAEALAALDQSGVDLILCDINMPVMDGLEFVKRLKDVASAKGVPVVMITTEGSESHVVHGEAVRVVDPATRRRFVAYVTGEGLLELHSDLRSHAESGEKR